MSKTEKVMTIIRRRQFVFALTLVLACSVDLQAQIIFKDSFEPKTLVAIAGEGGSIASSSGSNGCREAETCLIDVTPGSGFSDTSLPCPGQALFSWVGKQARSSCAGAPQILAF